MKKIYTYLIFFACLISGCVKHYVEPTDIPQNVSFRSDIIPLLTGNCESCHQVGKVFPDLILSADLAYDQLLTDGINAPYVNATNPESSILYIRMNKDMPQFGLLPISDRKIVLKWIQDGAKNN